MLAIEGGQPAIGMQVDQGGIGQLAIMDQERGRMALEDRRRLPVEVDVVTYGQTQITEEQRAQLMEEMLRNEREIDPSRESSYLGNTDYQMNNGLILRFHDTSSAMWI